MSVNKKPTRDWQVYVWRLGPRHKKVFVPNIYIYMSGGQVPDTKIW